MASFSSIRWQQQTPGRRGRSGVAALFTALSTALFTRLRYDSHGNSEKGERTEGGKMWGVNVKLGKAYGIILEHPRATTTTNARPTWKKRADHSIHRPVHRSVCTMAAEDGKVVE